MTNRSAESQLRERLQFVSCFLMDVEHGTHLTLDFHITARPGFTVKGDLMVGMPARDIASSLEKMAQQIRQGLIDHARFK